MLFPGDEEDPGRRQRMFRAEILADRRAGMGWGELAKKHRMNKSNLRRLVLRFLAEEAS